MPADQFSPSPIIETSGVFVSTGVSTSPARFSATMASADFPRHFRRGISPGKNALLPCTTAAFTSTTKPKDFAAWCQLILPCRPSMRFLSISSQVSPSLPPPGRLPFRSWLQVVVVASLSDAWFSYRGLEPHLQRAHAGRTPDGRLERRPADALTIRIPWIMNIQQVDLEFGDGLRRSPDR